MSHWLLREVQSWSASQLALQGQSQTLMASLSWTIHDEVITLVVTLNKFGAIQWIGYVEVIWRTCEGHLPVVRIATLGRDYFFLTNLFFYDFMV